MELAAICRRIRRNDSLLVTVEQLSTGIKNHDFYSRYSQALNFPGFDEQMIKS
jgi:hypothetical protein